MSEHVCNIGNNIPQPLLITLDMYFKMLSSSGWRIHANPDDTLKIVIDFVMAGQPGVSAGVTKYKRMSDNQLERDTDRYNKRSNKKRRKGKSSTAKDKAHTNDTDSHASHTESSEIMDPLDLNLHLLDNDLVCCR